MLVRRWWQLAPHHVVLIVIYVLAVLCVRVRGVHHVVVLGAIRTRRRCVSLLTT